jgi:hypothetical protein
MGLAPGAFKSLPWRSAAPFGQARGSLARRSSPKVLFASGRSAGGSPHREAASRGARARAQSPLDSPRPITRLSLPPALDKRTVWWLSIFCRK